MPNERTNEYRGSVDNRMLVPFKEINAIVETVGAQWTAVRTSPVQISQGKEFTSRGPSRDSNATFIGMVMKGLLPTFTTVVECLRDAHPNFAYIYVVLPRPDGVIN
jgi:NADPH2 dehydrogenase